MKKIKKTITEKGYTIKRKKEKRENPNKQFIKNGWNYIYAQGAPTQRGFTIGLASAAQFKKIQEMLRYIVPEDTGQTWDFFVEAGKTYLKPTIISKFHEFYEEMQGMVDGCKAGGTPTNIDEIIAWNNLYTLMDSWYPNFENGANSGSREGGTKRKGQQDHCSAFIAVGDYTDDGKIVMTHNSFTNFIDGQYFNVILDLVPIKGHRILMQTMPCYIWSGSDFFLTDAGIMGSETTIGGFLPFENNYPISCRIRKAMQYGNSLDDYVATLLDGNSGDYANSWLFGDTNTNEIMVLELGLKYHDVKRTNNGYFIGCNVAFNPQIRNLECTDTGYCDIRRHQGSRQVRLNDLVVSEKGKINVEVAKKIIADHYDVYLEKNNPCSRTVCSHYELDDRAFMSDPSRPKPYSPRGAVDGAIIDTTMAKHGGFLMKYGSSCEIGFSVESFADKHRQWAHLAPYLMNRPVRPWTQFYMSNRNGVNKKKKSIKNKLK
jgi:hypothetical protein